MWNYYGLEYEVFYSDSVIDTDDLLNSGSTGLMHMLSQQDFDISILQYPTSKEMGVGCACYGDSYACLIAIADKAPIRNIRERVPGWQEPIYPGETCHDKCPWLVPGAPEAFFTEDCATSGSSFQDRFEDESGFCKSCRDIISHCIACDYANEGDALPTCSMCE